MNKVNALRAFLGLGFLVWSIGSCLLMPIETSPTPWPTPSISELIRGFSSTDGEERVFSADWSGFYNDHPDKALLIPYLVQALSDPDREVRIFAAQSFRKLGVYDEHAVGTLMSWLDEEGHNNDELIMSIYALEVFAEHATSATPSLIHLLMNPPSHDPHVRQAAVGTLAAVGDPVAVPYLLSIFLSTDVQGWIRKDTAIALAKFGTEAGCGVPYLVPLLDSLESDVRIEAALIISQATENAFPGSERRNWDPDLLSSWIFEKGTNDEYLIVNAAKEWWQKVGQHEDWPECDRGLDGEPVLPAIGPNSTTLP